MHTTPLLCDLVKYPILPIQVHQHVLEDADKYIISQQFSKHVRIKYWKIKMCFYINWSLLNYSQQKIKIASLISGMIKLISENQEIKIVFTTKIIQKSESEFCYLHKDESSPVT